MKKTALMILIIVLILALAVPALAVGNSFSDTTDHWASETIDAMAEGGLIHGYSDGTFRPNGEISIAEMATIIAYAKGHGGNSSGYWAADMINYCINVLQCLPSQGEITDANYGIPCQRQLAIHMLMNGLGINSEKANLTPKATRPEDIPDYALIDAAYKEEVLFAYQKGVLMGKDDSGTFGPLDTLTRAEMATIFYRTGWIEAGQATNEGNGPTNAEIIAALKQLPNVTWTVKEQSDRVIYTTNELRYGGIEVGLRTDQEGAWISLYERKTSLIYNAAGQQIDTSGNVIADWYPSEHPGEVWPSASAYSYAARQLVKQILQIAYPTKGDEAYNALMGVFNSQLHETSNRTPSALRWYDGRMLNIRHADTTHLVTISIGEPGETGVYEDLKAAPANTVQSVMMFYDGAMYGSTMYELNKW